MDKYFLITLQEILELINIKLDNLKCILNNVNSTEYSVAAEATVKDLKDVINVTYMLVQRRK